MNNRSRHLLASLALSALTGWLAVAIFLATYIFVLPHGTHFAPEVGPGGAFIIFGGILSCFYLLDFLLITVPCRLFLPRRIWPGPLLRGICGAALFCLSVPLWGFASASLSDNDMPFFLALAAVAGAASFVVLKPSTE